jgi:dihydrolipoamide dehydrogenase
VVELTSGLLPGADRDLVKPLHQRLEKMCDAIYLETKVASLAEAGSQIEVNLEGPKGEQKRKFDRVLVSVGRRPNSDGLGLENTQVRVTRRGFVEVDAQRRTNDEHILAIGDVAGEPMLAHKATHEGKVAVEALLGEPAAFEPLAIPAVVFTDPEVAWAGLSETAAKEAGQAVEVARYPWAASGKAQALGRTEGLTKVIVEPGTQRILGVGIVGTRAGDLISEAVVAIEMGCTVRDLAESIHPHPTLGETLGNAAEMLLGTATEIYRPKRAERT